MINGIINVYKEKGFTSFDVVAKMRGMFHQKKIGHTGTLDPDAEGVLPVCLGRATKVCDLLTDKSKVYETVLLLGKVTDTQDISGTVLQEKEVNLSEKEVNNTILSFVGPYDQIPPMYSALKVNGRKLYDLAREGITVERKARPVTIHSIEILSVELPEVHMRVACSKGTYIRTLCQDIGEKLGCGGCMKELLRTRVAAFELKDAWKLSELEAYLKEHPDSDWKQYPFCHTIDSVFEDHPSFSVIQEADPLLYNGNKLPLNFISGPVVPDCGRAFRLYDCRGVFCGIYVRKEEDESIKPVKIFFEK